MRVYADQVAYEAFHGLGVGEAPVNVDTLLRTASQVVDRLLRGVVYDTDTAGMPTDADVAQAMSDATCAIAGELDATGVLATGATQEWDSVKLATVALSGRKSTEGTVTVGGLPVPAAALLSLGTVGRLVVVAR